MKLINKQLLLIFVILLPFFSVLPINAEINDSIIINEPQVEILDLFVDGSAVGGLWVNLTKDFDYAFRLIYSLDFIANSIDFDNFGGEASPLTNGFEFYYNNVPFLGTGGSVKSNDDFGNLAYDVSVLTDDKNPKGRVILGRLSFWKFVPDGLLINNERTLSFKVQDNISALTSINELTVAIEGYYVTVLQTNTESTKFDLLDQLERIWSNIQGSIIPALLLVFGGLMIWVGLKKFRK